jgi:hypothetical protein
VILSGTSSVPLRAAIERIPNCSVTFVDYPHELRYTTPTAKRIEIKRNVNKLVAEAIADYVEAPVTRPYVSIVLAGRHDNHLQGYEKRAQFYFDKLAERFAANPTADFEIIFVDYARDERRFKLLKDVLSVPPILRPRVTWVIVPSTFHMMMRKKLNSNLLFLEYVAKNIGVRRSAGEFVLAMNADSILSYQFVEAVACRSFNPRTYYLTSRLRIVDRLVSKLGMNGVIQLVEEPWAQREHGMEDFVDAERKSMKFMRYPGDHGKFMFRSGADDFIFLSRELFEAVGGFHEMDLNRFIDNYFQIKMLKILPGYMLSYLPFAVIHQHHAQNTGKEDSRYDAIWQYFDYGRASSLPQGADAPDWGAPNETFEMLHAP